MDSLEDTAKASVEGRNWCTFVEKPQSQIKYGIAIKFPVKRCRVDCNPHKIIAETIPKQFIRARKVQKGNKVACSCSDVVDIEKGQEEFLFGFSPKEVGHDSCNAEACWDRYQDIATMVQTSKMNTKITSMVDQINSGNHWSTKSVDDGFSADCSSRDDVYDLRIPDVTSMKSVLLKIGDQRG